MTHAELVQRGAHYLRRTVGCGVVLVEHTGGREIPDVIGWKSAFSYVIECKVSRADFLADAKKSSRASYSVRPAYRCYYLTPEGLLGPRLPLHQRAEAVKAELPDGWGLLELADVPRARVRTIVQAKPYDGIDDRNADQMREELHRFYCEVRRYQVQGITYQKTRLEEIDGRKRIVLVDQAVQA